MNLKEGSLLPRKKFKLAPDAARRRVNCTSYDFNNGAPFCSALTHPWCLAQGKSPEACKFRNPRDPEPEAEDGEAD